MGLLDTIRAFVRWDPAGGKARGPGPGDLAPPRYQPAPLVAAWSAPSLPTFVDYCVSSSVVQAVVMRLCTDFAQARPRVQRVSDGTWVDAHPLQYLLDNPGAAPLDQASATPYQSRPAWLVDAMLMRAFSGATYTHLVPSVGGRASPSGPIAKLVPYPHGVIEPHATDAAWVSDYLYYRSPGEKIPVPLGAVVPWQWLPHPTRRGWPLSPFAALLKEVDSDLELARYLKVVLQNDATPRTVIELPAGIVLPQTDIERLKREWVRQYGADNRGVPAIIQGGAKTSRMGMGFNELESNGLRAHWESRVCAVLQMPPMIAMLEVGLAHATYSNFDQAALQYTEGTLVPAWDGYATALSAWLCTPALYGTDVRVAFDYAVVPAMRVAADAIHKRHLTALSGGAITVNECRAGLGYLPLPDGDVRLLPRHLLPQADQDPNAGVATTGTTPADRTSVDEAVKALVPNGREH